MFKQAVAVTDSVNEKTVTQERMPLAYPIVFWLLATVFTRWAVEASGVSKWLILPLAAASAAAITWPLVNWLLPRKKA